jgi:hypothetical protein
MAIHGQCPDLQEWDMKKVEGEEVVDSHQVVDTAKEEVLRLENEIC